MADQLDPRLEGKLRMALRAEADSLPFTIRAAELGRLSAERRRARSRQRLALLASAAVVAVAIGGLALGSLSRPSGIVGGTPSPTVAASPAAVASLPSFVQLIAAADPGAREVARESGDSGAAPGVWGVDGISGRRSIEIEIACSGGPITLSVGTGGGFGEITIGTFTCKRSIERFPWALEGASLVASQVNVTAPPLTAFNLVVMDTSGPTSTSTPAAPVLSPDPGVGGTLLWRGEDMSINQFVSADVPADTGSLVLVVACSGSGNDHRDRRYGGPRLPVRTGCDGCHRVRAATEPAHDPRHHALG